MFERMKRKETKNEKRSTVKHKEVGNVEKNLFMIFGIFLNKVKKKENSRLLTTNDSTYTLTS